MVTEQIAVERRTIAPKSRGNSESVSQGVIVLMRDTHVSRRRQLHHLVSREQQSGYYKDRRLSWTPVSRHISLSFVLAFEQIPI